MSLCLGRGLRLLSNSDVQGEHPCNINNGAPLLKKVSFIVTFDPTTIIFDSYQYVLHIPCFVQLQMTISILMNFI